MFKLVLVSAGGRGPPGPAVTVVAAAAPAAAALASAARFSAAAAALENMGVGARRVDGVPFCTRLAPLPIKKEKPFCGPGSTKIVGGVNHRKELGRALPSSGVWRRGSSEQRGTSLAPSTAASFPLHVSERQSFLPWKLGRPRTRGKGNPWQCALTSRAGRARRGDPLAGRQSTADRFGAAAGSDKWSRGGRHAGNGG